MLEIVGALKCSNDLDALSYLTGTRAAIALTCSKLSDIYSTEHVLKLSGEALYYKGCYEMEQRRYAVASAYLQEASNRFKLCNSLEHKIVQQKATTCSNMPSSDSHANVNLTDVFKMELPSLAA